MKTAKRVGTILLAIGTGGVLYGCTFAKVPAAILSIIGIVKSICTIAGGTAIIKALWATLVVNANEYKSHPGQCYQTKLAPPSGHWVGVGSENCS